MHARVLCVREAGVLQGMNSLGCLWVVDCVGVIVFDVIDRVSPPLLRQT